jgi:carboxymethylenebutenolidase
MSTIHFASPSQGAGATTRTKTSGVIVLHPWWGLNADIIAFADRLAERGFEVAAPDLFEGQVATTVEDADRLSQAVNEDVADSRVLETVDALLGRIGDPSGRIGAVGFSFGGAWALWLPAQRPEVVATVVYYGSIEGPSLSRARTPVLGHFAENDPYESAEGVAQFEQTLRTAGRDVEIDVYPGTGHWFAEPTNAAYEPEAAELAFERTVTFLNRHLREA